MEPMGYLLFASRSIGVALLWMTTLFWSAPTTEQPALSERDDIPGFSFSVFDDVVTGESVEPGSTINYSLVLTNTSTVTLTNVQLTVLVPLHTAAPAPGSDWLCAPADFQPARTLCRASFPSLAGRATRTVAFALAVALDFPQEQTTLILEANAEADDVVCGDCGYAWCETPIVQGSDDPGFRLMLPFVSMAGQ